MAVACKEVSELEAVTDGSTGVSSDFTSGRCTFKWTIKNFAKCNLPNGVPLVSPTFRSDNEVDTLWELRLYPNGFNKNSYSYVSLLLSNVSKNELGVYASYGFAFVTDADEEIVLLRGKSHFYSGRMYGSLNLKLRNTLLLSESKKFLTDDELTVVCHITSRSFKMPRRCEPVTVDVDTSIQKNQLSLVNLSNDISSLSESKKFSDVKLKAEGKELDAHKLILSARSSVFSAIFQYQMKEGLDDSIYVEDVSFETLQLFVDYLYSGIIRNLTVESAMKLFVVADKYNVSHLRKMCILFLTGNLNVSSVVDIVIFADLHGDSDLKSNAIGYLVENREKVICLPENQTKLNEHSHLAAELLFAVARGKKA